MTFVNLSIFEHPQYLILCKLNLLKSGLGNVYGYSLKSVKAVTMLIERKIQIRKFGAFFNIRSDCSNQSTLSC